MAIMTIRAPTASTLGPYSRKESSNLKMSKNVLFVWSKKIPNLVYSNKTSLGAIGALNSSNATEN